MKRILKVGAVVLAIALIALLIFIVNGFAGNPISSYIAKVKITNYVNETYPDMEYTMTDVSYNFKNSDYGVFIQSETSEDTQFRVAYRNGEIRDYYDDEVKNKFTTFRRFDDEFNKIVKNIIAKDFPYEASSYFGTLKGEFSSDKLELDMIFDPYHLPIPASVVIWTEAEDISYDVLAERLLKLDDVMSQNKMKIETYTIYLQKLIQDDEKPGTAPSISVHDFPKENIAEINLNEVLENYVAQWEKESEGKK